MATKRPPRIKTNYPEVYFEERIHRVRKKIVKFFYVRYKNKSGNRVFELVGNSFEGMTPAKANKERIERVTGKKLSNTERRIIKNNAAEAEENKWTINKLWETYYSTNKSLKRINTDFGMYKNHLKDKLGKKEPHEIMFLDVERIRINLLKKLQPATVWGVLELLRRLINFGTDKNFCTGIKFKIKMPKVNNEKTEDLTAEQFQNLLDAIEADSSTQAKNLMKFILLTGMRRGELFNLKWDDIDFEKGFLHIRSPKGGKDQKIPLNDSALALLKSHEKPYPNSQFVFPGRNGNKRTDIKLQVNRIKKRAGLPKHFRPLHGLRHVYASMLASSGKVDMYTLQKLLTHKSPQMTQRYAHLRDEALKQASEVSGDIIDEIISNGKKVVKLAKSKT
jgi:integrase